MAIVKAVTHPVSAPPRPPVPARRRSRAQIALGVVALVATLPGALLGVVVGILLLSYADVPGGDPSVPLTLWMAAALVAPAIAVVSLCVVRRSLSIAFSSLALLIVLGEALVAVLANL